MGKKQSLRNSVPGIDPKLDEVLANRKPSPKLAEANVVIGRLIKKPENKKFFGLDQEKEA